MGEFVSMNNLKFLVTGTGRCGTVFMARLLTSAGIPCGHESVFDYDGIIGAKLKLQGQKPIGGSVCSKLAEEGWVNPNEIVAESSYMAVPYLFSPLLKKTKIIHVVRNPLDVISSFVKDLNYFSHAVPVDDKYQRLIYHFLPVLSHIENQIIRACYYYIEWNIAIEKSQQPKIFHRIEDDPAPVIEFVGGNSENLFSNKTINTMRVRKNNFSFSDIPNGPIKKQLLRISERYYGKQYPIFL